MSTINLFRSMTDNRHETIHAKDNIPIQEAIKEDLTNAVIAVNGFERDENYRLQEGDLCTIRLFPDGDDAPALLTGSALGFVVGLLVGGPIGAVIGAITGAGVSAGAGALIDFLAPQQPDLKSPEAIKSIPQLRGAKNQSNYNKPIPIVLGKHLYTPMYIGMPYTEIGGEDGEDQYFNALFLLGYGKLQVRDIKLGILGDLCSNEGPNATDDGFLFFDGNAAYEEDDPDNNPKLELRQGASEVGLYPQKVFEEQLSIELTNFVDDNGQQKILKVPRFTARDPMKVQVEFTFGGGLIRYNDEGKKRDATVDICIQWKKPQEPDADYSWKPFGKIGIKPGGTYEAGITYNNGTSTITRQKSKVMRFIAEKEFTYSEVKDAVDRTIELRVFRASAQDINNTRISDKAHLTAIRTWCFDYGKSSASNLVPQAPMLEKYRDKTCRLGFRIKASGAVQGTLDALNCVLQSYGRTWDGENWTDPDDEDITQNPASIALKLLQSPSLGSKAYPDSMLDLNSFGAFYKWCNDKNFSCNGVLTSKKKVDDILAMVLETGRAIRILNGHQYGVLIDQPREAPVTILNSQNVLEASNQKAFADLPDGLCVNFINEADGYSQNEAYAMHDGSKQPGEGFIETIDMPFVTNYDQVYKNAMYQLACRHLRPEVWMRKLGIYGHLIALGDRVEVQDDTILVGIGEGAAITDLVYDANGNMTGIQTDGLFDVTDASQRYGVKITQYDGVHPPSIRTKEVTTPGTGVYSDFVFAAPIATTDPLRPSIGDFVSFGVYDRITTPALCFGKKDNGDGTFDVTLVPYQEGIYTADSGSIPEFDSKLTPPQKLAGIPEILPDTVTREEAITIAQDFVAPGPPATVYQLIPGATVIKRYNTGVIEPPTISCAQQSITGDAPPVTSNKTLKYVTERAGAETLYKGPAPVGDWEFIEFRLYDDSGVLLDRESIPVLTDGPPATVYHLIPSVPMIVRNPSGVAEPSAISCAQQVVVGNKPPEPSGKTIVYCTSANQEETDYTGAVPVAWDWIEFRLRDGETLLDQERVFVLSEGEPARTYKVQPSVSVIKVYDGVADPYKISCSQASITGNGLPVPSNKTLKYATSAIELVDAGKFEILHYPGTGSNIFDPMLGDFYPSRLNVAVDEQPYTGEITVNPAWGWIEFRLYDGDILLDKERVPVLADGAALIYMDLADQHITVRADEYGKPYSLPLVTQATLYNGNTPITNVDFMAKVAAKNIVHYPGNIFDPMLGDFYPVRLEQWSVSQGAIDQNGLITIAEMPEDQAEITVRALYDGVEYTAMLTLIKVKDGESPAIIDIENENASIACDSYGVPFPGELPFVTKALFYKGTEPAAPFWHLNTPIRGVSIAQDGTITVAEDAELDRSNNILALAAYRGKTYSRMFTLTKTLEGFTATVYELLPGARVVRRDAAGNNTPETLSCAQQKIVGNGEPEPAGKTLVYVTSASSEETPYTDPVPVGSLSWIEFRLYSGQTLILDRERVPVVSNGVDGADSITLDLENENTTVRCDAYGVPYPDSLPITARATLYDGWDEAAPAWSLESPPAGVTIAQDGTITVAKNAALGNSNNIRVKAQYKDASYVQVFTIGKTLDGESPVSLNILPDAEFIQCDHLGNPLRGLPLTAQATLTKGTQEITAAMELAEAAKADILHYPGTGGAIFDPMPGGFYPTLGYPVVWTLAGAPAGVTIDRHGLITVSATAQLNDINAITVRAAYHGKMYEAVFEIVKERGGTPGRGILSVVFWYYQSNSAAALTGGSWTTTVPARTNGKYIWQKSVTMYTDGTSSETKPVCISGEQGADSGRYRGVTNVADTGNTGTVRLTSGETVTLNDLDWVLFMGTADWTKARLYQWHAIERVWKAMAPAQNLSHYMDVLETITENAADGIFSNVFCRVLFAQQAAINTLESQLIRIANAIYGGERFNTDGSVLDSAKPGFWLGADGRLIASNAQISGIVNATSGTFNDITISGDSLFQGAINSGPLVLSNDTPQGKEFTYAVGTGTSIIYNDAKDYFGFAFNATADSFEEKSYSVIGTYGDMSIIRIGHYWENGGHGQYYNRTIYVYNINGEKIRIAYNNSAKDYLNIQSILSFRYALSGKTFKLLDLPIMKGAPGAVYNDNGTLKISP